MKKMEHFDFLNSDFNSQFRTIVRETERKSDQWLRARNYDNNFLLLKEVSFGVSANLSKTIFYGLKYVFFKELEIPHFRENEISLIVLVDFLENSRFYVSASISSIYKYKDYGQYNNIECMDVKMSDKFKEIPTDFPNILDIFFQKAFNEDGEIDDLHLGIDEDTTPD